MIANPRPVGQRWSAGWAKVLFWGWNIIFSAFMLLGFAPQQLPSLFKSVQEGITPPVYLVECLVLIAFPILVSLIGFFFLRKRPQTLFALGYVLEWPLMLIMLFYFIAIKEGNPSITVLLVWLAIAEITFLWYLLDPKISARRPLWILLCLAGLTLLFSGTIYAAAWLAFYVPPLVVEIYRMAANIISNFHLSFGNLRWVRWNEVILGIIGQTLFFFSIALILIMPIAAPILAGKAWLHSLREARKGSSLPRTLLSVLLPLALVLIAMAVSLQQPQHTAFQLLKTPPSTSQQAQALLQRQDQIRSGLLNAYLASFRYISSEGEVRHINDIYRYSFQTSQQTAWQIEQVYEVFLKPFLYSPVHPVKSAGTNGQGAAGAAVSDNQAMGSEQSEAAVLYQRFFDRPIAEAERAQIVAAVRSTSNPNQAELAWQVVDDREVHLNRQEVTISEHADWADVQIYEVYQNRTFQRQEVVYYFSLPESAVVTGLWLGSSPDRGKAYAFQVAPRGAAQAVYRNEVRYNRDPALLEQIGPVQYRLRAFPVEPQFWIGNSEQQSGPELHLWMTYRTVSLNAGWPLPKLAQKFNVYWDKNSTRLINGKPSPAGETDWLPASVTPLQAVTLAAHRVDFSNGISVLAQPASAAKAASLPGNLRLAVVLDRSFSMRERAEEVNQALASLKQIASGGPDPDVYLTASEYRGEKPGKVGLASLSPNSVFYFGGQNAAELLAQYETLNTGKQYDVILVLTDGSGYELGQGNLKIQVPNAPLWLVHLGGSFPLGYDDPTLQAIQASGGGTSATVNDALARYAVGKGAPGRVDEVDGYVWQTLPTSEAAAQGADFPASLRTGADDSGFTALAARRVILSEMARNHAQLDQVAVLDGIHNLAVEYGIVTPFSSMLVLVNGTQEKLLDTLSQHGDRFQREVENVGQTAAANPFAVTGVPEPEEWLLLILSALALAYVARRKWLQKTTAF